MAHLVAALALLLGSVAAAESSSVRVPANAATEASGSATARAAVSEAETLVQGGDFAAAQDAYRRALEISPRSPDLLYNHGTAALKAGRTGVAVLSLERAARLAPRDGDIDFNLSRALERVGGELGPVAVAPRPWQSLTRVRLILLQRLSAALLGLALLLLALRLLLQRAERLRTLSGALALFCWLLATGAMVAGSARWRLATRGDGVIVGSSTVSAREAPGGKAPSAFALEPGHRIQVVGDRDGYVRVRLNNGLEGWVEHPRVDLVEGKED